MKRSSRRSLTRVVLILVVLAAVGVVVCLFWPPAKGPAGDANGVPDANAVDANMPGGPGPDANSGRPGGPTSQAAPPINGDVLKLRKLSAAEALAAVTEGNKLLAAKKLAEARTELSKAVLSDSLPAATASTARKTLSDLADRMIFSREVCDGDPYTAQYTFQPGEVLVKVERKLKLHVPTQILLRINGIRDARSIRAGQTIKVIKGPFHAVVTKSAFTMDIYLHREGCPPVYVKQLSVGVGKDGSTPVGLWRVGLGKKLHRAPWNPPPNSPIRTSIAWGEPDYPLGTQGYWLGLEGIAPNTRMQEGYGIHGTNDPTSIGKAASLGCIRLADPDIELVFYLLYEKWSTVRVRP